MSGKLLGFRVLAASSPNNDHIVWSGATEEDRSHHKSLILANLSGSFITMDIFEDIEMDILVDSRGIYKSSDGDYFKVLGIEGARCYAQKGKDGPDGEIVYSGTHYWFLINGQADEVDHGSVLVEKLCGELFSSSPNNDHVVWYGSTE